MKTVTIGSFKGGTGKTTLAAILSVQLALSGYRVKVLEFDRATRPLARFLAAREFADLPAPTVLDLNMTGGTPDVSDWQTSIRTEARYAAQDGCDVLLIDTASLWRPEVIAAHLQADTILTTITESPIDLYQLMPGDGPQLQAVRPYMELVELVRRHGLSRMEEPVGWNLCLNRRSHLATRVGTDVRDKLVDFSHVCGMSVVHGLIDRVAYRNMMATGITPLDTIAGEPLPNSMLAARTEVKRLAHEVMASVGAMALRQAD